MAGRIFLNYRRGDDPGHTGRLFDHLQQVFPPEHLFMDVDTITPGLDFVRVLQEAVAKCDVFLAVIGKGWVDARDGAGAKRLDNPNDFVRLEIESALTQGKRVIPVLIGDVQMPQSEILPTPIKPLARRHAVRLTHERFRTDVHGLVKVIQQALHDIEALRAPQAQTPMRPEPTVPEPQAPKNVAQQGELGSEIGSDASRAPAGPHKKRSPALKKIAWVSVRVVAAIGLALFLADLMNFRIPYVTYAYWAYGPTRTIVGRHSTAVSALAFSPNGETFASGGDDFRVRIWNTENLEEKFSYEASFGIDLLAFSPNGKWLAVQTKLPATNTISVQLLDAATGSIGPSFSGGASGQSSLAFSPDSLKIATSGGDLWDIATRKSIRLAEGCQRLLAISPDGRWVAAADATRRDNQDQIFVCDAGTGQLIRSFGREKDPSYDYAGFFGSDYFITMGSKQLIVWSIRDGRQVSRSSLGVITQAFTCNVDCSLLGWADVYWGFVELRRPDPTMMREPSIVRTLWSRAPRGYIYSLAISPDRKRVVAGGDRTIELWDVSSLGVN